MERFIKMKFHYILIVMLIISSCTSDFDEINTNPNSPTEVPSTNILAYVLYNFTINTYDVDVSGGESGYANQIGKIQYMEEAIYSFRESTFNTYFADVYRNQMNLQVILEQAEEEGATNMKAAATTWSAFIWLIATDMWRDIPFTDALGATDGVYSPSYDKQETIYPAVMDMLEEANTLFNEGASDELGEGDVLFNGDLTLWQKFANSLRLRMAMRLSNVEPETAKAAIQEILGDPTTYPIISSNDDNATYWWVGDGTYDEPWYTNSLTRDDHGVADVIIDQLAAFNDPRISVYAKTNADDEYNGVVVGDYTSNFQTSDISRIGTRFRNVAAGFSPLMNYAEVCFIKAEAAANGWYTDMTAEDAYVAGITASMEENEVADADIATYLAQSKIAYTSIDQIYLQKWLSLYKNGPEAWAETRRTDVPQLSAAPDATYTGHNRPPFRQPYPTNEYYLNTDNISTYWNNCTDRMWGQQMYWDTRTGVE